MPKIFAHRGFSPQKIVENSIDSLHAAYKNNFAGIEFDVWFIDGELIVMHDRYKETKNSPKFRDYFYYHNKIEYWIDFKNLDKDNAVEAAELVRKEIVASNIDLKKVYFAPYIPNLKKAIVVYDAIRHVLPSAQIMALCQSIKRADLISYHNKLKKNHIKFVSVKHEIVDSNFMEIFSDINCFAWTVNDIERLRELQKLGIKNLTSDNITPAMI